MVFYRFALANWQISYVYIILTSQHQVKCSNVLQRTTACFTEIDKCRKMIILGLFFNIFVSSVETEAAEAVAKVGSSLESNHLKKIHFAKFVPKFAKLTIK